MENWSTWLRCAYVWRIHDEEAVVTDYFDTLCVSLFSELFYLLANQFVIHYLINTDMRF